MKHATPERVPVFIRCVNFTALVGLGILLVFAAVVRPEQLIGVLAPMFVLIGVYWVFQNNPTINALYFAISVTLFLWIVICENIVFIDNLLGSQITRELSLNTRLQTFAQTYLRRQDQFLQTCCGDPLSFNYKPGTLYQRTYDCGQTGRDMVTVDSTGYLNRRHDLIAAEKQVDMFVAGDSVLQGFGVPSIVEFLNESLPIKTWNVSISHYGPMQKVNALATYGLPRHPKWLLIEFFAGNDVYDAIIHEACKGDDFRCLFGSERIRRVANHPEFSELVDSSRSSGDILADYAAKNLTLATTRYLISNVKGRVRAALSETVERSLCGVEMKQQSPNRHHTKRISVSDHPRSFPGLFAGRLRPGKELAWQETGLQLTYKAYDKLAAEMGEMSQPPTVILLYNPSAYEIYRNFVFDPDREGDRVSELQRQMLLDYARKRGWKFVDLTDALRDEVIQTGLWIYGANDWVHWSPQGTAIVASLLAGELERIFGTE